MDNTKDTPRYKKKADVIEIIDNLNAENASLKLELQKQKELNAELVKVSNNNKCELLDRYTEFLQKEGYIDTDATMEHPTAIDIFLKKDRANESLIKKSSEI